MKKVYRKALKPYIPYMARAGVEPAHLVGARSRKRSDQCEHSALAFSTKDDALRRISKRRRHHLQSP
jgi:hypothetical protein